ncbi:MAG: hypothetical protein GWN41_11490 [Phycisphaerae bacterium]|nr:hypothetical protein [Phycisphaerae bacterium]
MQNLPVSVGSLQYEHFPRQQPGFVPNPHYRLGQKEGSPDAQSRPGQTRDTGRRKSSNKAAMDKDFDIERFDF